MSTIDQAPPIRAIRDLRIGRRQVAVISGASAWAVVVNVGVAQAPLQLVPTGLVGMLVFVLIPAAALWAGVVSILGYHRARGPFPGIVWHYSATPWRVGQEVVLDPQYCRIRSRIFCLTRPGRKAAYAFERRPRKSDIAANRAGRGTLFKLEVSDAPAAHYRRWDGTGAIASLRPLRARVTASHGSADIS